MKYAILFLLSMFIVYGCTQQKEEPAKEEGPALVTKTINYSADGTPLKGYIAYDSSKSGKRPGIIVVHEWWGMNDYAEHRADSLAKLGYIALAIDMYGNGKTAQHPDNAGKFAQAVMSHMDTATARFNAGLELLKNQPQTDTSKLAAIGYCFGGGVVLRMALAGVPLDGVVSFHGDLPQQAPKNPDSVKAAILVCNGAADPFNPPEKVNAFKSMMDSAGIDYSFKNYEGAKHAFTNPASDSLGSKFNLPLAYNKQADEQSWKDMQDFFNRIFK
jgi:dienelactone hydrolase